MAETLADDPLWYKDAVIYQAHVKSFFDSNNDGIGDFQGLTQKLDYLQSLGITCIWLLPFYPSPLKDDGYDIADYTSVHPSYGTIDDFKAFVDAAHTRGIRVLIELVVNHTSDQHPWFQRARHAPAGSWEREFYVWSDTDTKFPETRIIFTDTEKSNWAFDPVAKQYYWHRFFSHQPDLNHNNPAVVEAVIDVMRFWLDLGVDALRLDAVPYLCVREGTNNENLPETHDVLKRIRRELDARYRDRMLLAEANQWPADVRDYFGDGDECHMAFHFPLMPRMFMALRQEDRHAVTEILNQTPDLPSNCQWALFLRNHDELTLEMVTDEERDYMYQAYAADPQMRLNVGIRRRLAPLVENSRRRIELLNMLLFSMPGTPIVYYGDEIGMGDNIYLGDRNGVRTPMQWSGDRNGGFSRADTARLFAPPIVDPVYGYQSVNVEAHERAPFSLLNWMKRLIALRRQHRVFGRGTIEFLPCANRKVLAYVRRSEDETVLVLANLSRTLQPAEIDLSFCAGLTPVEMFGLTEFPKVEPDRPAFFTLAPYGTYWFSLVPQPMQVTQQLARTTGEAQTTVEGLPALLMGVTWDTVFDSAMRQFIERQALRPFLQRQRWFASKARAIADARFTDWLLLRGGPVPAFVTLVSVTYTSGDPEQYVVPLAMLTGDDAVRVANETPSLVLARITGARKGVIVDALVDDDVCNRLVRLATGDAQVAGRRASMRGVPSAAVDLSGDLRWVRAAIDQSNSVLFLGDRYVLKLFRRIEEGLNPEFEISEALAKQGFAHTPRLRGAVAVERRDHAPGAIAVVQDVVAHQGTGWSFTIDELKRYYERVVARTSRMEGEPPAADADPTAMRASTEPPPFFAALERWYLAAAETLGRRTAELHRALAGAPGDDFTPEPFDREHLLSFASDVSDSSERVLAQLRDALPTLPEETRSAAEQLLATRDDLLASVRDVTQLTNAGLRIRVHGDYHLGQVLRTEADFVILDFEGEPARTLAERRARHSPLKDVAGMLRSFDYAAHAALLAFTQVSPATASQLRPWAETWRHWVSRAFLDGYRDALADTALLPSGVSFDVLLQALIIDKAIYEVGYELNNRPEWARIPLQALVAMASSLQR
ncbi:MAG: maltose alpha-D-glucosyltransferase [Acidobacteria bacterium]|nr:maltose alpha-D-glucosyltransferase [Acidobacteriota bacterium]